MALLQDQSRIRHYVIMCFQYSTRLYALLFDYTVWYPKLRQCMEPFNVSKSEYTWIPIVNILMLCGVMLGLCEYAFWMSADQTFHIHPKEYLQEPVETTVVAPPPPASPTTRPTTHDTVFAAGSQIAGIDIGGLDSAAAAQKIQTELDTMLYRPLELLANETSVTLKPEEIDLEVAVDDLLASAFSQVGNNQVVNVPLKITFNESRLHHFLTVVANQTVITPTVELIHSTTPLSRSFGAQPGRRIDVDVSMKHVHEHLQTLNTARMIDLPWSSYPITPSAVPVVGFDAIYEQIEALAKEWDGVVGFFLHDLQSGTTVTLNEQTVFSGASLMKLPILLHAYISLPEFDQEQRALLRSMIVESDNLAANGMLAASVGGEPNNTDAALEATGQMNAMLQRLGLQHTYQYMPYEAYDYLVGIRGLTIPTGPTQEGTPPYTQPDLFVRTTPAEMGHVLLLIDQCSRGEGTLLEQYGTTLASEQCREMLDLLAHSNDTSRMYAGMPAGTRIEHKSGWTENTNADVGIVRSSGGDVLLSIFVYQETDDIVQDDAAHMIAALARVVYTAYNPVDLGS